MYVTRRLSLYRSNPAALMDPPPEGPNSGYLVILDEKAQTYTCFGKCKDPHIKDPPFPQNKKLTITYAEKESDKVIFIPVLVQPLSSHRYYVIKRGGKHQGKAITNSRREEKTTCLCCSVVHDVKPSSLDPLNIYQQVEIIKKRQGFQAKSVAREGIPPKLLRKKGWRVSASTGRKYCLNEASGVNSELRARLPDFNFPLSDDHSRSTKVGEWYCPFMFVKEGKKLKDQMRESVFYEMTLEQRWEKIYSKENSSEGGNNAVQVGFDVQTEAAMVGGSKALRDERSASDGVLWFEALDDKGRRKRAGLSLTIVERMKWEQERIGWTGGNEGQVRIERVEEFGGSNTWKRFCCYVLVESFVLKRRGGEQVLSCDYFHTHQVRCKWD